MGPTSESIELYERARRHGWWHRIGARLRGRPTHLLSLATIVAGGTIGARHALGAQTVPIERIRGSEGRRDLFDDAFHPLGKHTRARWMAIATAWFQGVALPPVDLIRVGDSYVVRDGHHRISVLRALGIAEIDAIVTAWDIGPAPQSGPGAARRAHGMLPDWRTIAWWRKAISALAWNEPPQACAEMCLPAMRTDPDQRTC